MLFIEHVVPLNVYYSPGVLSPLTFIHRGKLAPQVYEVLKAPRDKEERPVTWEEQDHLVSEYVLNATGRVAPGSQHR